MGKDLVCEGMRVRIGDGGAGDIIHAVDDMKGGIDEKSDFPPLTRGDPHTDIDGNGIPWPRP